MLTNKYLLIEYIQTFGKRCQTTFAKCKALRLTLCLKKPQSTSSSVSIVLHFLND